MLNMRQGFVIAGFRTCSEAQESLNCFSLAAAIRYLHCYGCLWFCRLKVTTFYFQQGYYFFQPTSRLTQAT